MLITVQKKSFEKAQQRTALLRQGAEPLTRATAIFEWNYPYVISLANLIVTDRPDLDSGNADKLDRIAVSAH